MKGDETMPRFHSYHPQSDFKENKLEKLTAENLDAIRISLETNNLFRTGYPMGNEEQLNVYRKIVELPEPVFIYVYQANMGSDCRYTALFKGLFFGKKGLCIVLVTDENEGKPEYCFVYPYHIGKIKIIPYGKMVGWLNYEVATKWALWKDRCEYHPRSVEDPEWPGLVEL
jgi:hypothetical protein